MRDVASALGVSSMTISRALRRDTSVAPETRAAVLKAVAALGYVPDQTAGSLSSRRSRFVAALIPSLNNPHFSETAQALSTEFEAHGLQLLLGYTNYDAVKEEALVTAMLRRKPEALVLTNDGHTKATRAMLRRAKIPIFEMWDLPKKPIGRSVGFSNTQAMHDFVRALAEKGYRRIVFLGERNDEGTRGAARRAGYLAAVAELGLEPRLSNIVRPPATMSDGAAGLDLVLSEWPDSDLIICVSDPLAFGVIMACRSRGIVVPETIAVAGFGDFEVARVSHPSITTVSIDAQAIGQRTARAVLDALAERTEAKEPGNVILPVQVTMRESA